MHAKLCTYERENYICDLTEAYCVGLDEKGKHLEFYQKIVDRCPMCNINAKRRFRKSLAEQVIEANKEAYTEEDIWGFLGT